MARRVRNEVELHSKLRHPNILRLYHFFEDQINVYLVMELCELGELYSYLRQKERQTGQRGLDESHARSIFVEVARGLFYLHQEMGIIHRDLKLSNILLNQDMHAKIADFGLAVRDDENDHREHNTICGTPNYLAPYKSDLY